MESRAEKNKLHMKKADIILIVVCLLSALLLAVFFLSGFDRGHLLQISYDGKVILMVQMEENMYYLITYENQEAVLTQSEEMPALPLDVSYNLVHIAQKEVNMEAADCRDQICVHHRPITGSTQSIICLPHRLAVEITGGEEDEIMDGMVK